MCILYSEYVYLNLSTVVLGFDKCKVRGIFNEPRLFILFIYYLSLPISPSYRPDCVYAPAKAMQLHRLRAHTPANEAADSNKERQHRTGCAKPSQTDAEILDLFSIFGLVKLWGPILKNT